MTEKIKPCEKTRPDNEKDKKHDILNDSTKTVSFITTKKGRRAKRSEFYVDPELFKEAIVEYYETEEKSGKNYEFLGECFLKIATGLTSASSFTKYTWKQDMITGSLINMLKALHTKKFSLAYGSSPFSFFTQISKWVITGYIKKEKKRLKFIKDYSQLKYLEHFKENEDTKNVYIKPEQDSEIF